MPISRGLVVALATLALCVPSVASANAPALPTTGSGVSLKPPVTLAKGGSPEPAPRTAAPSATATTADRLPKTGADPRLLFLMGTALTLVGVGLRLQTADADGH